VLVDGVDKLQPGRSGGPGPEAVPEAELIRDLPRKYEGGEEARLLKPVEDPCSEADHERRAGPVNRAYRPPVEERGAEVGSLLTRILDNGGGKEAPLRRE